MAGEEHRDEGGHYEEDAGVGLHTADRPRGRRSEGALTSSRSFTRVATITEKGDTTNSGKM